MTEMIIQRDGQAVTTSLQVAEDFGKQHKHVLESIDELMRVAENPADLFHESTYTHEQNKQTYRMFYVNRDGFALLAFGFSGKEAVKFKQKYINAFNQMEKSIKQNFPRHEIESFEKQLIGVEYAAKLLRVDDSSKVRMLEAVHKQHNVPTNHLPAYVSEEIKRSLTDLLKEHDAGFGAAKANNVLIKLGLLEIKERPSSNGKTKEFKSLTELGLQYGNNEISPRNPRETQPLYYPSKFAILLELIKSEV